MNGDGIGVRDCSWVPVASQEGVPLHTQEANKTGVNQSKESPKFQFKAYKSALLNSHGEFPYGQTNVPQRIGKEWTTQHQLAPCSKD